MSRRGHTRGRFDDINPDDFDRPRRRTKPRTKDRPTYAEAETGRVLTVDRGRFTVLVGDAELHAVKARPLGRKGVVVGDLVKVVGDTNGNLDSLARIVEIEPRSSTLRRTADDDDPVERIVVANAEQLVVVVALADPEPRVGLIDRALVAALDAAMTPILVLTKADLASADSLLDLYEPLDLRIEVTERGADVSAISDLLAGRISVLLGHSGVGKSTLVNALVPEANRATGHVNATTGRGRHTSTSAVMVPLGEDGEEAGWIIDTPGIRSFGLAHVAADSLLKAFPDLQAATASCARGCSHAEGEPECGLGGDHPEATAARVSSFHRLLASRTA